MYDIFISYRRKCRAEELALMLYEKLTNDGYSVSHDHSTFHESKLPFDITIKKRIHECTDFVCIISQDTFDRCEAPDYKMDEDWVVCEIVQAIEQGKNVIPIRLDIDVFPKNIPTLIKNLGLTRYNGPKYSADYFDAFYVKLKDSLKTINLQCKNAEIQFEQALFFLNTRNNTKGVEMLFEAASNGSSGAYCKLGELFLRINNSEEWNVEYNPQRGVECIYKAYLAGYPPAFHKMGLLYLRGLHVSKDPQKAVELFKDGASLGDLDCMNELGLCYLNGVMVLQDNIKAVELFKKSADRGNVLGMINYALCCKNGCGIQQNLENYFKYIKLAALLNHPEAHHHLACAYFIGEGTCKNLNRAFIEFEKAYNLGVIDDILNLAYCYEHGCGTKIDINKAVELLEECVERAKEKKRYDLESEASCRLQSIILKNF